MFRRKLTALDYHNPAGFNCRDETEFRNFIVWLEDQKIRHYKIEDRGNLRNIHSSDWPKFFEKYLRDVNCPFKIQDRQEAIDWLLGLAVRLEYGDNAEKYKDLVPDNTKNADNAAKNAEPLINLDVNNPDFKAGVMALANLLQIQRHDDYLVMLKAIRILVQERLTQDAVAKANQTKEGSCSWVVCWRKGGRGLCARRTWKATLPGLCCCSLDFYAHLLLSPRGRCQLFKADGAKGGPACCFRQAYSWL
uniref:RNA transcription, translation and transport factor protein n=1 Tax=Equus caballus TaxID=9796 RepID=F6SGY9_HORSE